MGATDANLLDFDKINKKNTEVFKMKNLDKIAEDLFNKIRGRFDELVIGNDEGKVTTDPAAARFYSFKFNIDNTSPISVSIALFDDKLSVLYNQKNVADLDNSITSEWFDFLKSMRIFAKRRLLSFDTRDIKKSNLDKRDYKFLSQDTHIVESVKQKRSKYSRQKIGETRIKITHNTPMDTSVPSNISRNIKNIFIEASNGERFIYPYKNINAARAMARHINEGGTPYDDFGRHITEMNEEVINLNKFRRHTRKSKVMAEGLSAYIDAAENRIKNVQKEFKQIQSSRKYKHIVENFENIILEEVPETISSSWVDQLTIKHFNEELKDVFPYVYRLVSETSQTQEIDPDQFFADFED